MGRRSSGTSHTVAGGLTGLSIVRRFPVALPVGLRLTPGRVQRIAPALLALWVLGLADLLFTLWAHRFTAFHELNPLARGMLLAGQFGWLVSFKLAALLLASAIFWRLRSVTRAELALWAMVAVYFLLALRWSDYTQGAVAML